MMDGESIDGGPVPDPGPGMMPDSADLWVIAWLGATLIFSIGGWVLGTAVAGLFVADPILVGALAAGVLNATLNVVYMRVVG
jgi:hypothetical protein